MRRSNSLSQNRFSTRILSSKVNYYREKFNQSQQKFNHTSKQKISQLNIYKSHNKISKQTLLQSARRQSSKIQSSQKQILNYTVDSNELNPEKRFNIIDIKGSVMLKQLDSKAMQITRYGERNSELLQKKSSFQIKILNLKRQLMEENKRLSEIKCNCGHLTNQIEQVGRKLEEKIILKNQLLKKTHDIQNDNNNLTKKLNQSKQESNYNKKHIVILQNKVNQLSLMKLNTNTMLLKDETLRISTRDKLSYELKVMENVAATFQQITSQKKNMQSQIDKAFNQNKLKQFSTKSNITKLPVHSTQKQL